MNRYLLFLLLVTTQSAFADGLPTSLPSSLATSIAAIQEEFVPEEPIKWMSGIHLLGGIGVSSAYVKSRDQDIDVGIGMNIRTDVGYYFADAYAIDLGISVVLNQVRKTLVWDTQHTLGFRTRLPAIFDLKNSISFLRVFGGRGPLVTIARGNGDKDTPVEGADRVQAEGNIVGAALGFFQKAKDKTTWFVDLGFSVHDLQRYEVIQEVNGVPEVVDTKNETDGTQFYTLNATMGIVFF
ncbi:MAG: hypothetical protein EOP10_10265 [Proteobacteria bacterium]|nr:MAG: hypothetical protein EOP10_10265 [Pseudomonadota bacterium]